jgi:hypothetical protein
VEPGDKRGVYENPGKAMSSLIIQTRTENIGSDSYLHGMDTRAVSTNRCRGCNEERETLYHVPLNCPSYMESRLET